MAINMMLLHSLRAFCRSTVCGTAPVRSLGLLSTRAASVSSQASLFTNRVSSSVRLAIPSTVSQSALLSIRGLATLSFPTPKTEEEVKEIVIRVCKEFDKIPADKFTVESRFIEDLGLDSLDHIELIMAMEDEFEMEIPVQESEKIKTANQLMAYLNNYIKNSTNVTV